MDLLIALRPEDFTQATEKLGNLGFPRKSDEMQLLVSAWCNADIRGAAAFVVGGGVPELVRVVAEDWAIRDYDQAAAWSMGIEKPDSLRDYALARVILPSVEKDPGRALATVLRATTPQSHIGQQVVAAIMSRRPGVIQGLIGNMPEGSGKQLATWLAVDIVADGKGFQWSMNLPGGAANELIETASVFTPAERAWAAAWIASYLITEDESATSPQLFLDYTLDDRAAATALVESMPAGGTRESVRAGVAAAISLDEGIEAGLAYLQDGPDKTRSLFLKAWAGELVKEQTPAKVLEQSSRLAEFPEGKAVIRSGFLSLRKKDMAAADRWLEANPQFAPFVEGPRQTAPALPGN